MNNPPSKVRLFAAIRRLQNANHLVGMGFDADFIVDKLQHNLPYLISIAHTVKTSKEDGKAIFKKYYEERRRRVATQKEQNGENTDPSSCWATEIEPSADGRGLIPAIEAEVNNTGKDVQQQRTLNKTAKENGDVTLDPPSAAAPAPAHRETATNVLTKCTNSNRRQTVASRLIEPLKEKTQRNISVEHNFEKMVAEFEQMKL